MNFGLRISNYGRWRSRRFPRFYQLSPFLYQWSLQESELCRKVRRNPMYLYVFLKIGRWFLELILFIEDFNVLTLKTIFSLEGFLDANTSLRSAPTMEIKVAPLYLGRLTLPSISTYLYSIDSNYNGCPFPGDMTTLPPYLFSRGQVAMS